MILIVDDDRGIVRALQRALRKAGYKTDVASDGLEAYQRIKKKEYACVLLDVNMPVVNGVELLLALQGEGMSVPAVVMAGFNDFEAEEMKLLPCVKEFLCKPFQMADMLDAIEVCCAA